MDRMSQDDPDRTICFCNSVSCASLVAAIRAGHRTLEQIQKETRASTGCGGCEFDVAEILEAELAKIASEEGEPSPVKLKA
jgi:NAD(P)H-nitrite reductase large subunit